MKRIVLLLFVLTTLSSRAQYVNPNVKWELTSKQVSDHEFELKWTAKISPGFHLYSGYIGEGGPIPTSFSFDKSSGYKLEGKVKESGNKHEAIEPLFENMKLIWFEEKGVFTQKVKLLKDETNVKGVITFMTCNDQMCDPPSDHNFEIKLKATVTPPVQKDTTTKSSVPVQDTTKAVSSSSGSLDSEFNNGGNTGIAKSDSAGGKGIDTVSSSTTIPLSSRAISDDDVRNKTYWGVFVAGFLTGLLALFFPCVWPVIPLTVSYFLKHGTNKRRGRMSAVIYALSITIIFVLLGVFVSLVTNGQKLNELSTGWFFNMLFFALFFLFGLSFLGVFEITLPSGLINRTEALSEKGGLIGIFFMAFTLVLVSFSCTLPFIANLISLVTQENEFARPLIGFAAFGLALGLPFGLFAWFPSGLKKLPKSGGWMHALKVTFGFIEIALSLIYLSKVDMAYHWNILSRDIFLAIWVILFGVLGFYLLGKIHLSPDDDVSHISVPRLLFGVFFLAFALYLTPGLWGSPLEPLSGFLPNHHEWDIGSEPGKNGQSLSDSLGKESKSIADKQDSIGKKYGDLFEAPLGLDLYFDYDDALKHAKEEKKPLFIDFTGWGCVNCRKMEKSVWPNPDVLRRLKEDYISASLYVDDKTKLDTSEQYYSNALAKKVVTLGDKNFDIQYSRFNIGAQPYYVLLDDNGNLLTQPRGYTPDPLTYIHFLDQGLVEFKKRDVVALR